MKLFKVSSDIDEKGVITVYVDFLGKRYVWKDDIFIGKYRP